MNINSRSIFEKILILSVFCLVSISCKTNKIIADGKVDNTLSAKGVIKKHYGSKLDFKTLSGKMKIDYSDGQSSQGVSVSLRMEKDKAIWLSAPLGMVKVYITPQKVSFYNKLQNEYFNGDFSYLSQLLGTELDFENLQNLLLGEAVLDLRKERYNAEVVANTYQLKPRKPLDLFKILFQIEPKHFKMASQQLSQPLEKRLLEINYQEYQEVDSQMIPNSIAIAAIQGNERTTIDIDYRNIELNKSIKFPYKIPKGFDEIILK
ncbi:DUF4292 domain-containing protein [Costertonia aggregata]|uniref:DUF4292 domain-containing protein n=1 Tax=Costertonia aggregata TaxID=343403 RepID=A0A7H9AP79_9FLAO|nr:DUF4292 domain-containing protein [Costertonia aggregata]QLG45193.1 DUF4292 domain-containing protein [Costertonia aggregata]